MPDASKRVSNDLGFELRLTLIDDMREHIAAASPVGSCLATVHRGREHLRHLGEQHAPPGSIDASPNTLSRNRTPDEHNLPLVPREHSATGDGLLDLDGDQ